VKSDPPARHVVVVGGGISGLAAAYFLTRGSDDVRVTVLDKASRIGGHLRLAEVAGYPVDVGAESVLNRRPEAVDLARVVGLERDLEIPLTSEVGLWTRGRLVRLPPSTVMGVPADARELFDVLSADEVSRVAAEPALPGLVLDRDVSVGSAVSKRMGRVVTERLVEPFLGGVYAGRADELSLYATMPDLAAAVTRRGSLLLAAASVRNRAAGPKRPVFAGIRGGVGRLPAAVAAASGAQIRTGTTVRRVSRSSAGWEVETGPVHASRIIDADAVIVAVPASPAARMLRDAAPAAATELATIEYASVAIVTLAIPVAAVAEPPRWSGYLVPPIDRHVTKAVTISSVKWAWQAKALTKSSTDLLLLRASIGRHRQQSELQHEDEALVNTVFAELSQALGVTGRVVDATVTRWGGALPQYAVGHGERVARIRAGLDPLPGLAVCGAAYDGVGVAACVASAQRAADRIRHALGLVPLSRT
jgi:oxygen-dependent protoporphyrinogen oxidase